jgi:teichuronic acid biosynthesis glycosyltransferase TuaG
LQPIHLDDFALWLELTRRGFVAHCLKEDLMRYRVVQGSHSRNKARSAVQVWRTYRKIEQLSPSHAAWCLARYALNAWRKHRKF